MKLRDVLIVNERIMKDAAPTGSIYAFELRAHMQRMHPELLDEEVPFP